MNLHSRVKICGITRLQDALWCQAQGVHALGFVFYQDSQRYIEPAYEKKIIMELSPFIMTVGLFVNASAREVEKITQIAPVHVLQFHGEETERFCYQFGRPYIKSVSMQVGEDIEKIAQTFHSASALLYDAPASTKYGGTGRTFDWSLIPRHINRPWILAGGLNSENIREAIKQTGALNLDVSSGVESAPGIKDPLKIKSFLTGVRHAKI